MADTITAIDSFLIPADERPEDWCRRKPYVYVRVRTSAGVYGWGECHTLNYREPAMLKIVGAMAEHLIGRDATEINHVVHLAYNKFGEQRVGIDIYSAMAGIEIALYDALGKTLGCPVSTLLGGKLHDHLDVYANLWSGRVRPVEDIAARAQAMVAKGFSAIKIYPFQAGETVDQGIATLRVVRQAVGDDVRIAVDLWRHATPAHARRLCEAMEEFNLAWIEDPFEPESAGALSSLRMRISQPIMTGETFWSRRQFRELFEREATDFINPDICATGITEFRRIAAMAEPYKVQISPHNYNSMALGLAVSLAACAGISNLGPCEYFPELDDTLDDMFIERPRPRDGKLKFSDSPGLGIDIDESVIRRWAISG